jgi:hypothetical protein
MTSETLAETLQRQRDAADAERAAELPAFVKHAARIGADFTLTVATADQLRAVLVTIGGHNNYNPRQAADRLGDLVADAMQVQVEQFVGGPAIYFRVPYTEGQRNRHRFASAMNVRLSDETRKEFAEAVIAAGRALGADEISTRQRTKEPGNPSITWGGTGDHPYEVRLWWD